jgi:rubrerythrin
MSIVFSGDELLNIAIGIERRGMTFYDIMAKSTDNELARAIFEGLANMEREHIIIFENMMDETGRQHTTEVPGQKYTDYVRALIDDAVFTDDMITSEMATQADSDIKAIELAISAEKDSILFYYEMRDLMPKKAIPVLERVIAEEKLHLQQLTDVKKRLQAQ